VILEPQTDERPPDLATVNEEFQKTELARLQQEFSEVLKHSYQMNGTFRLLSDALVTEGGGTWISAQFAMLPSNTTL
jgi:hypothetical protein